MEVWFTIFIFIIHTWRESAHGSQDRMFIFSLVHIKILHIKFNFIGKKCQSIQNIKSIDIIKMTETI